MFPYWFGLLPEDDDILLAITRSSSRFGFSRSKPFVNTQLFSLQSYRIEAEDTQTSVSHIKQARRQDVVTEGLPLPKYTRVICVRMRNRRFLPSPQQEERSTFWYTNARPIDFCFISGCGRQTKTKISTADVLTVNYLVRTATVHHGKQVGRPRTMHTTEST